jgi:hypothetical protein
LRGPGVERRQRFLQQDDLAEAGGLCRLGGQVSRHLVERGGDGQNDLAVGQVPLPALRTLGVKEPILDVLEVAAGAVEGRLFPRCPVPRKRRRLGSICGFESHDLAEVTRRSGTSAPWSRAKWPIIVVSSLGPQAGKGVLGEFVAMRDVYGRRQRRLLADLVRSENLRDFDDLGLIIVQVGDRDRAVACPDRCQG